MATKKKTEILLPILNTKTEVFTPLEKLEGKTIKIDLTRMLRGKSLEAVFKIKNKNAELKSLKLLSFYIRRLMRRNISYVEDSFICESKDSKLRVKPFLITRKKVHRSVRNALRIKTKEFMESFCSRKNSEEIFSEIISARLQRSLSLTLKKIYPLALCEIRDIEKLKEE